MADALCGPSNAAKGLTRHLDQDRSLQRDRFTTPGGVQDVAQSFRSLRLNQNNEFSSFQQQNAALPGSFQQPHHADWQPLQPRNDIYPKTDLLKSDPLDWAKQFTQWRPSDPIHMPGAPIYNPGPSAVTAPAPATYNQGFQNTSFSSFFPHQVNQAYPAQSYTAPTPTFQDAQTHHPDTHNPDFDFDNELRAWCAANGPEAETQVNEWLQGETTHKEQVIEQQATTASVDAHQLAEPNLVSLEEEVAPVNTQDLLRKEEQQTKSQGAEDSELAQAAQQILDSVSNNESAKFRESSFMQMMRKIAARDLVVRDNSLVDAPGTADTGSTSQPTESTAP